MEFNEVIKERYSCKSYDSEKPLEKEKIEKILEAGRLAPTAKNLQEQHIYVAYTEEALKKIDECTPCRYGAPVVLVVTYDSNNVFTYPESSTVSGPEDGSIVATHMMLAAADEGVNSCWINNVKRGKLKELMNIPENEEIVMLLDLGYKKEGSGPLEKHYLRKELSETVTWL